VAGLSENGSLAARKASGPAAMARAASAARTAFPVLTPGSSEMVERRTALGGACCANAAVSASRTTMGSRRRPLTAGVTR
jgi:hypothetical protein